MTQEEIESELAEVKIGEVLRIDYAHSSQPNRTYYGRVVGIKQEHEGPVRKVALEGGKEVFFNDAAQVNFGEQRVEEMNENWRFDAVTYIVFSVEASPYAL